MSDKIRVVLVDDHPILLKGLRTLLGTTTDVDIVGEATNGQDAISIIATTFPDVVILDYALPGISGAEVAAEIARRGWPTRVLAFSAFSDDKCVQEMLQAGATSYLLKGEPAEVILAALGATNENHPYYSKNIASKITTQRTRTLARRLTERECEVLDLIAESLTNREIAQKLGISLRTVEFHVSNILAKLEVTSRVGAAIWLKNRQ